MTAVLTPSVTRRSTLAVSDRPTAVGHVTGPPALRVIEGGRSDRARSRRRMFIRRRIAAAVVGVVLSVALAVGAVTVAQHVGGRLVPAAGSPSVEVPSEVVVGSGDTLWGISTDLGLPVDTRVVVAELADANGGDDIVPGQRLVVPEVLREMA